MDYMLNYRSPNIIQAKLPVTCNALFGPILASPFFQLRFILISPLKGIEEGRNVSNKKKLFCRILAVVKPFLGFAQVNAY